MTNMFEQPHYDGQVALLAAIEANDVEALRPMIIGMALEEEDLQFAQRMCVQLSSHADEIVRGNAILGFGHLARLFGELDDRSMDVVRAGLEDESHYVRGQAHAAASDLKHFLGVDVRK